MSDLESRRIFLGMPGYGRQSAGAGRAFWNACADMTQVVNAYQEGSLLASNFNQLWCAALNIVNAGGGLQYFAMLHDDISAEDLWLDKLIAELEARQLDVLGVVVPIKDQRGLTSTALARGRCDRERGVWTDDVPDGKAYDLMHPLARLSMRDVYQLPETFTSDDVRKPLLLNTGCWVAKWNQDWCKRVHFEINDRIVFNTACNRYQAQTEPEDWHFSRQCHQLGIKIGATRKIAVLHQGEMSFSNQGPWGSDPFDYEHTALSPVPNGFPFEISGWLLPEEGKALAELARGKRVLEIGVYCGKSTVCMARTAEHLTAVDYFDGRATPNPVDTLAAFRANMRRYGVEHKVTICHPEAAYPLPEYDMAFIDGDHRKPAIERDIALASSVLSPDGLLVFHDYKNRIDPDVTEAVDDLLGRGGELLSVHNTVAVVRPPANIPLEV